MTTATLRVGKIEYRVVLIRSGSEKVLAYDAAGKYRLPRVEIPRWTRPVQQLQKMMEARWALTVLILDIVTADDSPIPLIIAELRAPDSALEFEQVALNLVSNSELSYQERNELELLIKGKNASPFASIRWPDDVLAWVGTVTGRRFSSPQCIEQLNAGGGFALLRLWSDDGPCFWLKATGKPNEHEFSITSCLSHLCPEYLPRLVASRKEWNAWLTEGMGNPLNDSPSEESILRATQALAGLQLRTIGFVDVVLASGAFDQRIPPLENHIDAIISYLIDAMGRQTSTKVEPLSGNRLEDLGMILRDACHSMKSLGIPDTLLHNDLNSGNILDDGTRCVFIDWSEAAIGNPFLAIERLSLLSPQHAMPLRSLYRGYWSEYVIESSIEKAYRLAPLLAVFAYLYGRGDWLNDTSRIRPGFESCARSLARHMDRAARNPLLLETLCC